MHRVTVPLVFVVVTVAALTGTIHAADAARSAAPSEGSSIVDLLNALQEAFSGGRYAYVAAIALVLAVAAGKKLGWSWLHTDVGGTASTLLGAFGASLAAALAPGGSVTPSMLWSALTIGVGAAGGYMAVKRLVINPLLPKIEARWPAVATLLRPLTWIFDGAPAAPAVSNSTPDPAQEGS